MLRHRGHDFASMRPGANRREDALAAERAERLGRQASMRPGANRREDAEPFSGTGVMLLKLQ